MARPDPALPAPEALQVRSPRAQAREARLNRAFSGLSDPEAFARARLQVGPDTRTGLLLPAPAVAAVDVDVPASAELHLVSGILPPELAEGPPSDGATLVIEAGVGAEVTQVWRGPLQVGVFEPIRADLSPWAGRQVRLRFRTLPGRSPRFDYVFLGDPMVAPRRARPRRVVVLFIDTLRADHLGLYGHERDTSPWMDALGARGTTFTQARSVAPWTLPAYRSLLTGRRPRDWARGPTLPATLRARGWATAMFAGNLYLSDRFDGARGWGHHRVSLWPDAPSQVERGIRWLEAQDGRDALLLLHFMDPHLPYQEPEPWRSRYAGATPPGWDEAFHRGEVAGERIAPEVRAWIRDRYDNNIRYVDDALERLDEVLEPDDLVVLLSDHGEEFWDHGGFEHGHTLYDEVVRVPLVLAGGGVPTRRVDTPVSLLDVTPTILDWAGLEVPPGPGRSLHGGPVPKDRALPLGHVLYGFERWGVVAGSHKYRAFAGGEALHQLVEDPGEQRDRLGDPGAGSRSEWRGTLAEAHGATAAPTWRVGVSTTAATGGPDAPTRVRIRLPGGLEAAWLGEDAVGAGDVSLSIDGSTVEATFPAGWRGLREVFVAPMAPLEEAVPDVRVARDAAGPWRPVRLPDAASVAGSGRITDLARVALDDGVRVEVSVGLSPRPAADDVVPAGYDAELGGLLRAAGYVVGPADTDD